MSNSLRKYLHHKWLKKRGRIIKRDLFQCCKCGDEKRLQVHHIYYQTGRQIWQYPDKALITLCIDCHKKWHRRKVSIFVLKAESSENLKNKYISIFMKWLIKKSVKKKPKVKLKKKRYRW